MCRGVRKSTFGWLFLGACSEFSSLSTPFITMETRTTRCGFLKMQGKKRRKINRKRDRNTTEIECLTNCLRTSAIKNFLPKKQDDLG